MIKVNDLYYNKNLVLKLFKEKGDVYVLDFANGIRLKIDSTTYNTLTSNSSFKPVGATYYNATQVIAKVFARDGGYYIEFVNGSELPISESDYNKLISVEDSGGDDVVVYDSVSSLPNVGENGKIYITSDTGYIYIYQGTDYLQVGGGQSNLISDLSNKDAGVLDSTAWGSLKSNHYYVISSPVMTGLDDEYEFAYIRLNINSIYQYVKISKNARNKYSGLFFIEESTNLYEIAVYYNGTNIILRCATVY